MAGSRGEGGKVMSRSRRARGRVVETNRAGERAYTQLLAVVDEEYGERDARSSSRCHSCGLGATAECACPRLPSLRPALPRPALLARVLRRRGLRPLPRPVQPDLLLRAQRIHALQLQLVTELMPVFHGPVDSLRPSLRLPEVRLSLTGARI